jgi:hypothetical protein
VEDQQGCFVRQGFHDRKMIDGNSTRLDGSRLGVVESCLV